MRYAIVLGGGRSRRMGTNKMAVEVDGQSLLLRTVSAALSWADEVVIAAPEPTDWKPVRRAKFTLEDPPFGGPVAGIKAAVTCLSGAKGTDQTLLLAGDLARPDLVVRTLQVGVAALELGKEGKTHAAQALILEDFRGWAQYLAGIYTVEALRAALAGVESERDLSVRRLLREISVIKVGAPEAVTADLDTPEDLFRTLGPEAC